MKKIILSAAMAIFAVAAYAQTKTKTNADVNVSAKGHSNKDKKKGAEVDGTVKTKSDVDFNRFDLNMDGQLSAEERATMKMAKKEKAKARKDDMDDDGILNGSAGDKNVHGKAVSEIATSTTLEGREKGEAISGVASSKSKSELGVDGILTSEEKAARKQARKDEARTQKADRADDGLLNGSVDANVHGKTTSGTAVGSTMKGKAKGTEVSTGARTKAKLPEVSTGVRTKAKVGSGAGVSVGKKTRIGL